MNILGIDFEDWYHPELIQNVLTNEKKTPRVINGLDKILDLLRESNTFATFFVVGELLEYEPELLDKILEEGHEVGFHTMKHTRLTNKGFIEEFAKEIKIFSKLTNKKSHGFRAPTFSLTNDSSWLIDILEENEYRYDSSVVPAKTSMYGIPNARKKPYHITSKNLEENDPLGKIIEFPLLITKIFGKTIPAAGGFYLRALPLKIIKNAIKDYEKQNIPATMYIHSWELVPELMPKISMPMRDSFVTYYNIKKAKPKMKEILKEFNFNTFQNFLENN